MAARLRRLLTSLVLLVLVWLAPTANAHDPFEITTEGRVSVDGIMLTTTMNRVAAGGIVGMRGPQLDDIAALRAALAQFAPHYWSASAGGKPLELRSANVALTVEQDLQLRAIYAPVPPGPLELVDNGVARLTGSFGNMVNLTEMQPARLLAFTLLRPDSNTLAVTVFADAPQDSFRANAAGVDEGSAVDGASNAVMGFVDFFRLGIEHILTGYDHLLFLAALLLGYRRVTPMLLTVTGFTLGHSITLSLAALGIVMLPPRLVETLIALSIVIVALENLRSPGELRQRFPLAAAFGLIHGLGFASALIAMGLGRDGSPIVPPLLGFNLGVETGQLIAGVVVMPQLLRYTRAGGAGLRAASVGLAVIGSCWVVQRAFS